jgi:hypothetical protein
VAVTIEVIATYLYKYKLAFQFRSMGITREAVEHALYILEEKHYSVGIGFVCLHVKKYT